MASKLILIVLSIYLLVQIPQYTQARDEELKPHQNTFVPILLELMVPFKYLVTESQPVFTKVVNDIRTKSEKSAQLEEYYKKFNDYIADVIKYEKKDNDLSELMKVFVEFVGLSAIFKDDKEKPLDADQLFIKESLAKNGIEKLETDFKKRFETFAKQFIENVEKWEATLSAKEIEKESKFFDWFKKFKTIKSEAQFGSFLEFLDASSRF